MIFGVGIDLCDAGRLEKSLAKQSFLDHVFAPSEQALLASLGEKRRAETAAANFAAKEAFLKAAGTGLGGFAMPELAVLRHKSGAPYFALTGTMSFPLPPPRLLQPSRLFVLLWPNLILPAPPASQYISKQTVFLDS